MNEIAIGLVVAAIVGVVALLRRQILRLWRKRHAVEVSVEPIVGEYWSVAFSPRSQAVLGNSLSSQV